MDQQFIELFDTTRVQADSRYLPSSWREIENDVFPPIEADYWNPVSGTVVIKDGGEED